MITPNTATAAGSSNQKASRSWLFLFLLGQRSPGRGVASEDFALATVIGLAQRVGGRDRVVHGLLRRLPPQQRVLDLDLQDLRDGVVVRDRRPQDHRVVGGSGCREDFRVGLRDLRPVSYTHLT